MRAAFNFESKYGVTMLIRDEWTTCHEIPPAVKGLIWYTDWSNMRGGTGARVYGNLWEEGPLSL